MKRNKWLALLLVLCLMLCLLPAAALADPGEEETPEATAEEPTDAEEPADAEESEDPAEEPEDAEEPPAEEPEDAPEEEAAPIVIGAEETAYAAEGDTVYNNGGTVYNNGGLVYNNGGTVYNNGGTAYNNGGVAYANGGTVYNNGGKVYSNGAVVYTFADDVEESRIYGSWKVSFAEDYSALAHVEGLSPDGLLGKDQACTIRPHEGYLLLEATADAGTLTENEDGSWTLSQVDADLTLTLRFQAEAPVFDLAEGSYAGERSLSISAPEGAAVYYTTDGSLPGEENGLLYEEPILLTEGVTVTAVALAQGAEPSEATVAAYAFLRITAPVFESVEEGYIPTDAAAFTVENSGSTDAGIKSVKLQGDTAAFTINAQTGGVIMAGKTSTAWTIRPVADLEAGTYTAVVVFTLDGGESVELEVVFTVESPAEE